VPRSTFIALLSLIACESTDDFDPIEGESTGMMQGDDPESSGETTDAEVPSPIVWEHSVSQTFARAVATDEQGRTYVALSSDDGADAELLVLHAYDTDGELIWEQRTPRYGAADDVALTVADGRIGVAVAVGDVPEIGGGITAAWVYDENGAEVWAATTGYHEFFDQGCVGIDLAGDDVALSGQALYEFSEGDGTHGFRVDLYRDGATAPAWSWRHAIDASNNCGDDVELLADGSVVASGRVSGDAWFVRVLADGTVLWKGIAPIDGTYGVSVASDDEGRLYFQADGHVIVADADANLLDEVRFDGIDPQGELAWSGEAFAIATADGVAIFDRDGALVWQYSDATIEGRAAAWMPDGDVVLLATGTSGAESSPKVLRLRP
jgi:hypothetical protein